MNRRPDPRRTRPAARALVRRAGLLGVLVGGIAAAAGCKTTYHLEDRDTPTQVVVEAVGGSPAKGGIPVVVYVGDRKGFDGTVRPAPETVRDAGPILSLRAGDHEVSVLVNGRAAARKTATVKHRTWIVVRLQGDGATIAVLDEAPGNAR